MGAMSLTELGSKLAGLMFIWGTIQQFFPYTLRKRIKSFWQKFENYFYPYVQITIDEFSNGKSNDIYTQVNSYLGTKSINKDAKYLKAEKSKNSKSFAVSLDEGEEIIDQFLGAKLSWRSHIETFNENSSGRNNSRPIEKKSYTITFNKRYKEMVIEKYLKHVMEEGKAIEFKNRKQKIYTNNCSEDWYWYGKGMWRDINFEHPATFDTLAMDPKKKEEIVSDLVAFSKGKDYYSKVGKAWKRGYLLYGPPGTGKSTMIAAIANFLNYDIYDLELTSVKDNSGLKKLLMETTSKSIIVIEDIDCSIDLTGKRKKKKKKNEETTNEDEEEDSESSKEKVSENKETGKLTLSGLLNFIDGIWSACGQERIIIFTTNHKDKLDPALIRRGRMDMHIEMSYCKYEAFKVLAKNYLDIETHPLFQQIQSLFEEVNISPCDVAENLMLKNASGGPEICLNNLIQALEKAKEKTNKDKEDEEKTSLNSKSIKKVSTKLVGRLKKLWK
ncbi:AAA-ATPase At3g28510-like [Nicotiana tabacum]|uniref:AAA-ATPase At3g28510-like n=1 Tax=Nicotiana tabacum TaxID=4097 RepID=A0A1S3Z731_TOBAC|nr:PREDICTED: AAA-ATPase At3g28610-like [Nicotiana tabacum]